MLILGPRSNRQREMLMIDFDKPRLPHPALNLRARGVILAKGVAGRQARVIPFHYRVLTRHGAVIGMNAETVVLEFAVSAHLCGLEALAYELGPVVYGSGEVAAVDVVEFLWEGPAFFCVVDFEFNVGGHPGFSVSVVLYCVSDFLLGIIHTMWAAWG